MPFRWSHLLRIAREQLRNGTADAAALRTAVNRGYYAALGEAREFVTRHGYVYRGGGSHEQVWQFLRRGIPGQPPWHRAAWKQIGDAGLAMKDRRVAADYYAEESIDRATAVRTIAEAEEVIDRLRKMPPVP